MMTRRITTLVVCVLVWSAGNADGPFAAQDQATAPAAKKGWKVLDEEQMTPEQTAQRDSALAARDAMFKTLKGRLMEVIGKRGPAAAIGVCQDEAPEIAARTSKKHGVAIGRTSFRLRNPNNQPPPWASPLVKRRVDKPTYLAGPEGQLGALLPIRLQQGCLTCHGPQDKIPPPVREALQKHYPKDRATGFKEDDLRGWFWVVAPPQGGESDGNDREAKER